jgi:two-component system response regulator PilR (NtrC family)
LANLPGHCAPCHRHETLEMVMEKRPKTGGQFLEEKKKRSILVVDDDYLICWAFQKFMKDTGYQVSTAGDGREAMEMIDSQHYDLIITGLRIHHFSGTAVLVNKARQNLPEAKLVLMSALATPQGREEAKKVGVNNIIDKPFQIKDVKALLAELLDQP